jgi:hypothetical protein
MLPNERVLQMIKKGKQTLGISDISFVVRSIGKSPAIAKKAEIHIWSRNHAEIVLYPQATFFSVNHELCHAKLYRMGIPVTNTDRDLQLFPDKEHYMRMIVIIEWYVNELQKRFFQEYYSIDKIGTPRPAPFPDLPPLPEGKFSVREVEYITATAKHGKSPDA